MLISNLRGIDLASAKVLDAELNAWCESPDNRNTQRTVCGSAQSAAVNATKDAQKPRFQNATVHDLLFGELLSACHMARFGQAHCAQAG